jgi:hypothetical protein
MRAIAILIVTLLVSITSAKALTLGELTGYCEQLESFWRMHPPTGDRIFFPNNGKPRYASATCNRSLVYEAASVSPASPAIPSPTVIQLRKAS